MFYDAMATTIESATRNQLDDLSNQVWLAYGAGALADDQAQHLQEIIQQRRGPATRLPCRAATLAGPPKGYFINRSAEQRSPDRAASIARRRMHAASGALPPQLAARLTIGEQAVCRVVADEFLAHGVCDLSRNAIAARAGVCHALAERTMLKIERGEGFEWIKVERRPRSGRKHLSNLTRIVSKEWLAWLAKGNRKAAAVKSCTKARPDFRTFRGEKKFLPRSADFKNSSTDRVDKSGEKGNRTAASRGGN